MTSIAIIQVDLHRGRFGHAVSLLDELAGKTILQHTIDRTARIEGLDEIVLMHPAGQSEAIKKVSDTFYATAKEKVSDTFLTTAVQQDRAQDAWLRDVIGSGRKWSLTAWRGGIGGMTVYDEMLPAYPFLQVMQAKNAESLVALRGDWCCIDPAIASEQLELHRSAPEAMKLAFTQAPPGLSPLVIHRSVVEDMANNSATVANLLCYNPKKPVIDPVGKDVNVQVPASVRGQYRRFVYDTPRAIEHLQAIAERLGDAFNTTDAVGVTDASREVEAGEPWRQFERLPQQLNVELSPRRAVDGPIVPQHHLELPREDMAVETIDALMQQFASKKGSGVVFDDIASELAREPEKTTPDPFFSKPSPSDVPANYITLNDGSQTSATLDSDEKKGISTFNEKKVLIPFFSNDLALLFGGLGDPLLHERWFETLVRATESGVFGVGIETDLLVDDDTIDRLATLPLDVIAVRINADSAATYAKLMGVDGYAKVMANLRRLFEARNGNRQRGAGFRGWIVPRLVKVAENLSDLETFFERWMTIAGWAVVDRAKTGRGLIPDFSPVPMEVPQPPRSEQRPVPPKQRLTVLSDGTVCLCGEDWLGRLPIGSLSEHGLDDLWRSAGSLVDVSEGHACVCPGCSRWLEAQRRLLASV